MKKLAVILISTITLAACTQSLYSKGGNATILSSKELSKDTVELTVRKDSGEIVTMTRQYDAHAAVGARVTVSDTQNNEDADLKTIQRYEFK